MTIDQYLSTQLISNEQTTFGIVDNMVKDFALNAVAIDADRVCAQKPQVSNCSLNYSKVYHQYGCN